MKTAQRNIVFGLVVAFFLILIISVLGVEQDIRLFLNNSSLTPKAKLSVNIGQGQAKVFLNGKNLGSTPVDLGNLPAGANTLRLIRDPNPNNFYIELIIPVELVTNSQTVVLADIGPSLDTSWYVTSHVNTSHTNADLIVRGIPSNAIVSVNGKTKGQVPVTLNNLREQTYKIELRASGFRKLSTEVKILKDKTVILNTKLYKIPLDL